MVSWSAPRQATHVATTFQDPAISTKRITRSRPIQWVHLLHLPRPCSVILVSFLLADISGCAHGWMLVDDESVSFCVDSLGRKQAFYYKYVVI